MLWEIRHGENADKIAAAALSMGHDLPGFIAERPYVWECCELYWRSFWALSAGRDTALGYGSALHQPLAYSEISTYAADFALKEDPDEYMVFLRLLRAMDAVFRTELQKRMAAKAK